MELKKKIIIGFIVVFVMATGIIYCFSTAPVAEDRVVFSVENTSLNEETSQSITPIPSIKPENESKNPLEKQPENTIKAENSKKTEDTEIFVYVCGKVNNPGVYSLQQGDRIVDAISAADGFHKNAAKDYLNQAMLLTDGEKIYVPSEQEARQGEQSQGNLSGEEKEAVEETEQGHEQININTASKEQLMTLQGIGEAKAVAILAYRESVGAFKAIEDIMNIEGIKAGVYDKIKDSIRVD